MPMDGLTLGFIARELRENLIGGRVDKIAQPERDEINLTIRNHNRNHLLLLSASAGYARAHLSAVKKSNPLEPPMFCMLLRKHLTASRLRDVFQTGGDRILKLQFESLTELGDTAIKTLVCEFMGKYSNLILVDANGRIIDSARHVTAELSRVREVLPGLPYENPPAQGKIPYDEATAEGLLGALTPLSGRLAKAVQAVVTGLSKQTAAELVYRATGDEEAVMDAAALPALSERICAELRAIPNEAAPALLLSETGELADVVAFPYRSRAGLALRPYPSLSEAMDAYYNLRDRVDRVTQKSAALRRVLRNNLERCEKKLALQEEALEGSRRMEEYRVKGELITAGQGQIRKGQKKALLVNYYDPDCAMMEVELLNSLSPAQNAQRYFKLYQKARSAQKLALEQKEKTLEELNYFEGQLYNLEKCQSEDELNEIREELEKLGFVRANHNRRQLKKLPPSQPLHFLSSDGTDILVGKNNLQNDKLTSSARPNEIWLHAKDMPGSHVIVLSENPSDAAVLEAALLAARYSKGRDSSLVPVDYARRKYVKKPAGAKPGFVIYTNQKTLYVTPSDENLKNVTARPAPRP